MSVAINAVGDTVAARCEACVMLSAERLMWGKAGRL